jgi:hypothetical protein
MLGNLDVLRQGLPGVKKPSTSHYDRASTDAPNHSDSFLRWHMIRL